MKKFILAGLLSFIIYPHGMCLAVSQPEKVEVAIIGAGPGGLVTADHLIQSGKNVVVFSTTLGGPILRGGVPDMWAIRESWKHHPRQQARAKSLGCSAKDVNGKAKNEDIQCLVKGLIKTLGSQRLKEHYTLVAVKTGSNADAPVELTFKVGDAGEVKTVWADSVEFAISPADMAQVKFTK